MSSMPIIVWSLAVLTLLTALAFETWREFRRMEAHPEDFTGSDRLAGSAE